MPCKDVCRWILYFMQHLHQTQAKTLADLVTAAVKVRLVSLAEIGRHLGHQTSIAAKHGIKRVDRFLANDRIEPTLAMTGVIRWLSRPSGRLIVSLDWVDLRSFPCLMLAGWHKGRAIPLLWQVLRWEDLARSQNDLEYGLLHLLRAALPEDVEVIMLADRGMGRAEMARLGRLLLLLALAYLLLSALGLFAYRTYPPQAYASNNRKHECRFFFLARWWIEHGRRPPSLGTILHELRAVLTEELVEENWG